MWSHRCVRLFGAHACADIFTRMRRDYGVYFEDMTKKGMDSVHMNVYFLCNVNVNV